MTDPIRSADEPKPAEGNPAVAGTSAAEPFQADAEHSQAHPANELEVTAGLREIAPEVVERRQGQFGVHGSPDVSGYGGLVREVSLPGGAQRPLGGYYDDVTDQLITALGSTWDAAIERVIVDRNELTFMVNREHLKTVMSALRDDPMLRFEMSLGVDGVHWPNDTGRELHAVYMLRSLTHNRLIRVETTCPDSDPHLPSTTDIYPTNDWHERETYDFFGIIFDGHPFLVRIEMPDDWPGHPQRKDYPLGGIPVEYKGAVTPPPDQRRSYS